jgi:translation initiation factor 2B subunit (eIF-2B alpha/beta/delta family)
VFGFEEPIEKRGENEIWEGHPKRVEIVNMAFEKVDPELVTGVVSELGVFSPDIFIHQVMKTYPFLA